MDSAISLFKHLKFDPGIIHSRITACKKIFIADLGSGLAEMIGEWLGISWGLLASSCGILAETLRKTARFQRGIGQVSARIFE